jgi:meso-butanediol dehydrogenase/(S,S)-butanediol dehydrogenase/diacetyl reductase
MRRLEGKTAVVTGGGSGIGRATALALAREGARVFVADLNPESASETVAAIMAAGGEAQAAACDVSDEASVRAMFEQADRFGTVDVLVNNAGVGGTGDAVTTTSADWDITLGVNLKGVWLCSRELIRRALADERQAAIVSTSSTNAFYAETGSAAYTASKGGVSALTRSMALDYAKHGIRVNCVCPGIIGTNMTKPYIEAQDDPAGTEARWGALHAMGRMGRPDEIAEAIVFLATPEASFFAGSEVVVDGGLSIGTPI